MYLGFIGMFIFFGLLGVFVVLCILLVFQLYYLLKRRFREKDRNISSAVLAGVVMITVFFPRGLIDRNMFRASNVLVAWQEGSANCRTYLELKEDNTFVETGYCFGTSEVSGNYTRSGDTIYFHNTESSDGRYGYTSRFAVLYKAENSDTFSGLLKYEDATDTFGYPMHIKLDRLSTILSNQ